MRRRVAIVFNQPQPSRYDENGESLAVNGVLEAVSAVRNSLAELDYEVTLTSLLPPAENAVAIIHNLEADLVFNLFEGFCGQPQTEAIVPEACDRRGLPYTGCPGSALRLALDKARAKVRLQECCIATPDFQVLSPHTLHLFRLSYPAIVKPLGEDASHGINIESIVHNREALARQVGWVSAGYGGNALVEEFVAGREFNTTVLGGRVLPVSEVVYSLPQGMPCLLTYEAKWQPDSLYYGASRAVCPARVGAEEKREISATALAAFEAIGCSVYARVDMRRDARGKLKVIEVNPNPDVSPGSGTVRQAEATGMSYTGLIERIVAIAEEEKRQCLSASEKCTATISAA